MQDIKYKRVALIKWCTMCDIKSSRSGHTLRMGTEIIASQEYQNNSRYHFLRTVSMPIARIDIHDEVNM